MSDNKKIIDSCAAVAKLRSDGSFITEENMQSMMDMVSSLRAVDISGVSAEEIAALDAVAVAPLRDDVAGPPDIDAEAFSKAAGGMHGYFKSIKVVDA
jgi:Asp-tRNA(Asn)/Glu-tRNA(Gln) amidotransferase C subunit